MILIAVGANEPGPLGAPRQTLRTLPDLLAAHSFTILKASHLYQTAPIGPPRAGSYLNAVVSVETPMLPCALMARLQNIEKLAGRRRMALRWSPRPLDLDLTAYHRLIAGWDGRQPSAVDRPRKALRGSLIVPHPGLHLRPFVIRPILDINPLWHHPVTGQTAFAMWQTLKAKSDGQVLRDLGPL